MRGRGQSGRAHARYRTCSRSRCRRDRRFERGPRGARTPAGAKRRHAPPIRGCRLAWPRNARTARRAGHRATPGGMSAVPWARSGVEPEAPTFVGRRPDFRPGRRQHGDRALPARSSAVPHVSVRYRGERGDRPASSRSSRCSRTTRAVCSFGSADASGGMYRAIRRRTSSSCAFGARGPPARRGTATSARPRRSRSARRAGRGRRTGASPGARPDGRHRGAYLLLPRLGPERHGPADFAAFGVRHPMPLGFRAQAGWERERRAGLLQGLEEHGACCGIGHDRIAARRRSPAGYGARGASAASARPSSRAFCSRSTRSAVVAVRADALRAIVTRAPAILRARSAPARKPACTTRCLVSHMPDPSPKTAAMLDGARRPSRARRSRRFGQRSAARRRPRLPSRPGEKRADSPSRIGPGPGRGCRPGVASRTGCGAVATRSRRNFAPRDARGLLFGAPIGGVRIDASGRGGSV